MKQVNNYLEQVKDYLSSDTDDDVLDELREAIEDRVAEQEDIRGEQLDDMAIGEILKGFGHPLKVASAYSKQQYLIGPGLYPLFKHALKLSVVAVFVLYTLLTIVTWTASESIFTSLKGWTFGFFEMTMLVVIIVTGIFASLERYGEKVRFWDDWDPAKLCTQNKIRANRQDSVTNVITDVIALVWWNGWFGLPNEIFFSVQDLVVNTNEIFLVLYWPVNIILMCSLLTYCWQLFSNFWTNSNIYIALVLDIAFIFVLSLLFLQGYYVEIATVDNHGMNKFLSNINLVIKTSVLVILGFVLYDLWQHSKLWIRLRKL